MIKFIRLSIFIFFLNSLFAETFSIQGMREEIFKPTKLIFNDNYHNNDKYISRDYTFSVDSLSEHVLISTPKSPKPQKGYPIIILIHGYIEPSHYSTYDSYKYLFNRFASSEFMVAKPDLRGHGRSEKNLDFDKNLNLLYYARDILQLILSLETLPEVDTNNIFLMGHSNGGDQILRVIATKPELIRAASLWGPTSVTLEEANFYWNGRGMWKYGPNAIYLPAAQEEIKLEQNLINEGLKVYGNENVNDVDYTPFLKDIITPMVIRHPDTDESVPYKWSINFIKEYKDTGNKTEISLINYPGDNHNIAKNQYTAQMADLDFFRSRMNKN